MPGRRGRKVSAAELACALCEIVEAVSSKTDLAVACATAGVSVRTHWHWKADVLRAFRRDPRTGPPR